MLTKGVVKGIISNLVIVEVDGPVAQNEIAFINLDGTNLMSEVIKVIYIVKIMFNSLKTPLNQPSIFLHYSIRPLKNLFIWVVMDFE